MITGAAVGLYFGLFFRPVGDPSFLQPVILGVIGGLVTAVYRLWRVPPANFRQAVGQGLLAVLAFTGFLVLMELRHYANAFGGRIAVALYSTIVGLLMGIVYAYFPGSTGRAKS